MPSIRKDVSVSESDYQWLQDCSRDNDDGEPLCWICRQPESVPGRSLAVDHDHETKQVRGLLCTSCNRALGPRQTIDWCKRAAAYLEHARRAFGDNCREEGCNGVAFIFQFRGNQKASLMKCRACGSVWTCGWKTHGIPCSWLLGMSPRVPFERAEEFESEVEGK
jgi:Recombination endonuclease VII